MTRIAWLLLGVGLPALVLAGCNDQPAVEAEAPTLNEEADAGEPAAGDETEEALDRIGEGAEALREGAGTLLEQGREAAGRALEDAGPALERAGEVADQVARSVGELISRARDDFDRAVAALEDRLEEAEIGTEPAPADDDAVLPPLDALNADTAAAARAARAGIGPGYVGVWAQTAEACGRIDREPVEMFAVITPTTIRRHESFCNFEAVEPVDGRATVDAECVAEGATEERRFTFAMPSERALTIARGDADQGVDLIRCRLP